MSELTPEQDAIIERAAERGARKALADLGLHDEAARDDVREIRTLLAAWRDARRTIWHTLVKAVTMLTLGLIALGAWHKWGGGQ